MILAGFKFIPKSSINNIFSGLTLSFLLHIYKFLFQVFLCQAC